MKEKHAESGEGHGDAGFGNDPAPTSLWDLWIPHRKESVDE